MERRSKIKNSKQHLKAFRRNNRNFARPRWRLKTVLLTPLVAIIVFLGAVVVRALTLDGEPKLAVSYKLPTIAGLESLDAAYAGNFAVAVDGKVVAGNAKDTVRPTASTAKMITALAVMQKKPFNAGEKGEIIAITEEDYEKYVWYLENNGSNTAVEVGEEISEYDALAAMLLASSNNMADTIARWAFGSQEAYREFVTDLIREWGLENTQIGSDASGYDPSTTSTASDLARISTRVMMDPVLAQIVGMSSYEIPVAGEIANTNQLLGQTGIVGVKTGFIGEASGYCLASAYKNEAHIITAVVLGAETREGSFETTLGVVRKAQELIKAQELVAAQSIVGRYEGWWMDDAAIRATSSVGGLYWGGAEAEYALRMNGDTGELTIMVEDEEYAVVVKTEQETRGPSFWERIMHVFGWTKRAEPEKTDSIEDSEYESELETESEAENGIAPETEPESEESFQPVTGTATNNCTVRYGNLMLINPNFTVETDFIAGRRSELISLEATYGIRELNAYNGDNLLSAEAAEHLHQMLEDYSEYNPGHEMETVSCFRAVGTSCGRLCAATGASDHHTGLTCDLIDPEYGTSLDTDTYDEHPEWQWLRANSYKHGFIDRFPYEWAGGPMSEPINVDENGSTGLFETWHFRYVGINAATEIATGKYNEGHYDSLEHYLKARGLVTDLAGGQCE